jgi:type IV secretion system protein TrbL
MGGAGKWIKKHPLETAGILAATMATGGAAAPALGLGGAAAAGAGAGGLQMGAGMMGALGGMGAEQAGLLAAQNAGLGLGADVATLGAAGTAGGGMATPWGVGSKIAGSLGKIGKNMSAGGLLSQPQAPAPQMPRPPQQQDNRSLVEIAGNPELEELKRKLREQLRGMQ